MLGPLLLFLVQTPAAHGGRCSSGSGLMIVVIQDTTESVCKLHACAASQGPAREQSCQPIMFLTYFWHGLTGELAEQLGDQDRDQVQILPTLEASHMQSVTEVHGGFFQKTSWCFGLQVLTPQPPRPPRKQLLEELVTCHAGGIHPLILRGQAVGWGTVCALMQNDMCRYKHARDLSASIVVVKTLEEEIIGA